MIFLILYYFSQFCLNFHHKAWKGDVDSTLKWRCCAHWGDSVSIKASR